MHADKYITDEKEYEIPEEIMLQLSYKDVVLNFFKDKKNEILSLRGGDPLTYRNYTLYDASTGKPVAKLSAKMHDTISGWEAKGYMVKSASVRFVVAWKPKDAEDNEPETAVLLADLMLSRVRHV